jgi:aspartyl-tRNA(Asn)/glutamyl-tRNA(Gln) amidotransferase subunit C
VNEIVHVLTKVATSTPRSSILDFVLVWLEFQFPNRPPIATLSPSGMPPPALGLEFECCQNRGAVEEKSNKMESNHTEVAPQVTLETITHLERLAYLKLSESDRASLVGDLTKVLVYARSLTDLDLSDFEPQTHAMDQANVVRADEVQPSSTLEQALANAPQAASPYLQVPRVLE